MLQGQASSRICWITLCSSAEGKGFLVEVLQLWGERYPASQEPRNTTKAHCTSNFTQEIRWERHKVSASAGKRNSRELRWRQVYIGFLVAESGGWFLRARFPQWELAGFQVLDLGTSIGPGGISSSEIGGIFKIMD